MNSKVRELEAKIKHDTEKLVDLLCIKSEELNKAQTSRLDTSGSGSDRSRDDIALKETPLSIQQLRIANNLRTKLKEFEVQFKTQFKAEFAIEHQKVVEL